MFEEWEDRGAEWNHGVTRVGETDAVLAIDDEIAWLIVVLAVEQGVDRDGAAVRREFDQASAALLRAVDFSVRSERQPIRPVGIAAKLRDRAVVGVEPEQLAFVDDAEQQPAAAA